jgi:hypothetical protein
VDEFLYPQMTQINKIETNAMQSRVPADGYGLGLDTNFLFPNPRKSAPSADKFLYPQMTQMNANKDKT